MGVKPESQSKKSVYIAIDLKSYYASVECVERDLNPLTANLLVADETRSDKTICLAVSPSLCAAGLLHGLQGSGERRAVAACPLLEIRQKYGPTAPRVIMKGKNMLEGATAIEHSQQIGGHRA